MIIYPCIKCKLYNPSEFMAVVFCSSMHAFIAPSKLKTIFSQFSAFSLQTNSVIARYIEDSKSNQAFTIRFQLLTTFLIILGQFETGINSINPCSAAFRVYPFFEITVEPDQQASDEAISL